MWMIVVCSLEQWVAAISSSTHPRVRLVEPVPVMAEGMYECARR